MPRKKRVDGDSTSKKKEISAERKKRSRELTNKNLVSLKDRSEEERKKIAHEGGMESVKVRRETKTMKQMLKNILEQPNTDIAAGSALTKNGFEADDNFHMARIIIALTQAAESGNVKAIELINKLMYGDEQNINVNMAGELDTKSRVQIYLPQKDEIKED